MRKSDWAKWLIVIPAMLGIVLVNYVDRTTDICGFGAFISSIWGLIEGILILTGSINVDGNGNPLGE